MAGSKNPKPKYLSPINNNSVIPTTGVARTCNKDVAYAAQQNSGNLSQVKPGARNL